jgi:hypothetical protein
MNLSNFSKLHVLRTDFKNIPYVFTFAIRCNETELFVVNRRENVDSGAWECHYVQHCEVTCEYCGNVELYSDCKPFTEIFQRNYSEVLTFIKENK